jgi:hypothetical protein
MVTPVICLLAGGPGYCVLPSRSETAGAPSLRLRSGQALALFARAGIMLPVSWICYAQRPASDLWRSSPALYHLLLLPAIAFSAHRTQPRYLPYDSGTDSRALSLCRRRVCRDAGTHSSAFDGTRGWDSLDRDAGGEAAHDPRVFKQYHICSASKVQRS